MHKSREPLECCSSRVNHHVYRKDDGGQWISGCANVQSRQDYLHSLNFSNNLLWKACHSLWPLHRTVSFLHRLCAPLILPRFCCPHTSPICLLKSPRPYCALLLLPDSSHRFHSCPYQEQSPTAPS